MIEDTPANAPPPVDSAAAPIAPSEGEARPLAPAEPAQSETGGNPLLQPEPSESRDLSAKAKREESRQAQKPTANELLAESPGDSPPQLDQPLVRENASGAAAPAHHEALPEMPKVVLQNLFEGPLDLLLHLIRVNEMDIAEVRLTEIADQYLSYLEAMKELNLEVAGDYLVVAATLLLLKARSLLPPDPTEGAADAEELDLALSTRQLISRLIEFRKFKEMAQQLRSLEEVNRGVFYRAGVIPLVGGQELDSPTQDIRMLFDVFARVLLFARTRPMHTVRTQSFRVEDKIEELRERIRREPHVNLREVFERCICKEEIIVVFLATLEMARLREITIAQAQTFDDILIAPWSEQLSYIG